MHLLSVSSCRLAYQTLANNFPLDSLRHWPIIDITRTGPPVAAGWVGATDPYCSGCSSVCPEQMQQEVEDGAFPIRQIPDN